MITKLVQIAAAYNEAKQPNRGKKLDAEISKRAEGQTLQRKELDNKFEQIMKEMSTQLMSRALKRASIKCPECYRHFSLITLDGQQVGFCEHCNSFWFDAGELKHFTDLFTDVPGENLKSRESKYFCPICSAQMKECAFLNRGNLLVDLCVSNHGVYLESGELKRALDLSSSQPHDTCKAV